MKSALPRPKPVLASGVLVATLMLAAGFSSVNAYADPAIPTHQLAR